MVKKSEKIKLVSEETYRLVYQDSFAGINAKISYTFTLSGHLMRGKYFLYPEYINLNFYIRDLMLIEDLLNDKYGNATRKTVVSPLINGTEEIPESKWAAYLSTGNLRIEYAWDMEKTQILLTLSKIADKPAIQVDYISKVYNALDIKEKKALLSRNM